jgi:hypothetical protein
MRFRLDVSRVIMILFVLLEMKMSQIYLWLIFCFVAFNGYVVLPHSKILNKVTIYSLYDNIYTIKL